MVSMTKNNSKVLKKAGFNNFHFHTENPLKACVGTICNKVIQHCSFNLAKRLNFHIRLFRIFHFGHFQLS